MPSSACRKEVVAPFDDELASYADALERAGLTVLVFDAEDTLVVACSRGRALLEKPERLASLLLRGNALGRPLEAVRPDASERAAHEWRLTKAQAGVLRLVLDGLTNKEIAQGLCISARTVEAHLSAMFEKAGVDSRGRLMAAGFRIANES